MNYTEIQLRDLLHVALNIMADRYPAVIRTGRTNKKTQETYNLINEIVCETLKVKETTTL